MSEREKEVQDCRGGSCGEDVYGSMDEDGSMTISGVGSGMEYFHTCYHAACGGTNDDESS